jgi:hypothetical protein
MTTVNWTLASPGSWNRPARWTSNVDLIITRFAGTYTLRDAWGTTVDTANSWSKITDLAEHVIGVRNHLALDKLTRVVTDLRRDANQAISDAGYCPSDYEDGIKAQARRTLARLSNVDLPTPTVLSSAERAKYTPQAHPSFSHPSLFDDSPSAILRSPGFRRFSSIPGAQPCYSGYDYDDDCCDYDDDDDCCDEYDDCCDRDCCDHDCCNGYVYVPVRRTLVNGPRFRHFSSVPRC